MAMKKSRRLMRCGRCDGTGEVVLTGAYLTTYDFLAGIPSGCSAAELARRMEGDISGEAMANRLRWLIKHDLVESAANGRANIYRIKGQA